MLLFLNCFIPHQQAHLQALAANTLQVKDINEFKLNLNKAVQTQQHLTASALAQRNRLAQQAEAQREREQAQGGGSASGVVPADTKLQERIAEARLTLQVDAAKANQDLAAKEQEHQQKLLHRQQEHQQKQVIDQASKASEILDSVSPPTRPTIPPVRPIPAPFASPVPLPAARNNS